MGIPPHIGSQLSQRRYRSPGRALPRAIGWSQGSSQCCGQQPQEGVEAEDYTQGEVYLNGNPLLPGDTLLHQTQPDVNDIEDHGDDVGDDHEGDEEPARHVGPRRDPLRPVLDLSDK